MAAQQRGSYMEKKPQYDAGGETFPILPHMNPLMPFHFFRQCGVLGQHDAEEHAGFERAEQQALCEFGIVKVEAFLDDNFADCFIERSEDMLDAQFSSLWVYPEKEIDKLVESLDAKDEIYIRILTYALKDEYVSFRTFSQGTWNIKF